MLQHPTLDRLNAMGLAGMARAFDELAAKGVNTSFEAVLEDLQARDARDTGRGAAPLKKADDAHLLDTSKLDIEAAVNAACKIIDAA